MEKNIKNKIVASIMIFILTLANFQGIITEGIGVFASSIENQNSETNHKNVDFNAQFMVINNEKKYSFRENISNEEIYLNIFTEIRESGYLKSGNISIKDKDEKAANFNLLEIEEPDGIQNIDYAKNEIILNQINNGEKLDVNIPIKLVTGEVFDLDDFSKDIDITFNGVYVNGEGEEKDINKEIELKAEWKEEAQAVLTTETLKVLPFESGMVISEKVHMGIQDFKLPIKTAKLEITVPRIGDVLPTEVRVEKINTSLNIKEEYKDGKLEVVLENNVSANNTITWRKVLEELDITYIFENLEDNEISEVQSNSKLEVECYSSEKITVNAENTNTINLVDELGNILEETTENISGTIYKGHMLNTTNDTEFKVKSNINIAYEKLVEKVEVKYNKDKFIINEEELEANTYYKTLSVSKENFDKILGETGELKVYSGETVLVTINKDTEVDELGNIVYSFGNNVVNEIKVETTKPIYSGILEIEFLKAISGQNTVEKEEIKNISHLVMQTIINENVHNVKIEMKNPVTKIGLETNAFILSTVVENENVEFTVTLNNNNLDSDLFKNPIIELCMPQEVTDLKINSVKLLLEDELVIKNYEYIKETNSIIVNLEGAQTKYNLSETTYGATIIVNTNITLDKLAVNQKDKIELFVTNEAVTSYESVLEEKGYSKKDINIVAPLGIITLNSAEGYDETKEETTTAISGNEAVGKIEPNAETKVATMKITAINNHTTPINNIRILGRVPFAGNKSLVDGTDLGTTFDAILKGNILSEAVPVEKMITYYSENGEATEDLSLKENGWVLEPEDLSKVKSYLIVLKDYEMQTGEKAEFKYEIEVPAGLELGNSSYGTYIVYYDNKENEVVFENTSNPAVVGLTTGEVPKFELSINSDIPDTEVARSGQIIKYTINVKNIGEVDASQVFVTSDIPEGLTYAELVLGGNYEEDYYSLNPAKKSFNKLIGNLAVGQEETIEYSVRVNEELAEEEVKTKVMLSAKDLPEMIESNEVKNLIDEGSLLIELKSDVKADEKVKIGDNMAYTAKITNISDYNINKLLAKVEIPEGLTYKNAYVKNSDVKVNYNESAKTVEWNIGSLEKGEYIEIVLEVTADSQKDNLEICVKASAENIQEHKSNIFKTNICNSNITVKQESTIPEGYVSIGDRIEYKINITNTGNLDATDVQIIDFIPEGMKYLETSYEMNGTSRTVKNSTNNEAKIELNIPAGESINMSVEVKADETDSEKQATNIVKVINDGTEIEANKLTHIIEAKTLGSTQSGEGSIELTNTYKISGTAFFDKNQNGAKDNEEAVLSGITVMLLDKNTGNIAKDANGQELNTTTEGNGTYTFRNLNNGEYIVVFVYDTEKYVITDYKKEAVEESKNSDVANMKITMNEQEKTVAVSDTLTLKDENIYNINLGLKEMPKFDMKLDKYVSKITVNNGQGAKTYNYDNTKLAKIEIDSKVANGTTLIIEYKLVITNEGSVAGYAKKIVDYIPKELKFSSELNSSWYLAEDGNVYSLELTNTKIEPGQSKEITLVLTKQVTGENTGLVNNNAEIIESYNDYGTADSDSVSSNKQAGEDDMSNADVYIGVKTGSPVTYIGLSIVMMIILGAGAYLINRKILIKK